MEKKSQVAKHSVANPFATKQQQGGEMKVALGRGNPVTMEEIIDAIEGNPPSEVISRIKLFFLRNRGDYKDDEDFKLLKDAFEKKFGGQRGRNKTVEQTIRDAARLLRERRNAKHP